MRNPLNYKSWRESKWCKSAVIALLLFIFNTPQAWAQMSSGTYRIPIDSLNASGQQSSSGSYKELNSLGEVGTGPSSSGSYKIDAGFLGSQQVYIAITSNGSVSMSPSISGISGGTGDGSMSWTVTTDSQSGYSMFVHSSTNPAMRSANGDFNNYTPATSDPDYNWSVLSTDSEFGFTPEGTDIIQRYKDNGSACNTGSADASLHCWDALTTSDTLIAKRTTGNHPSGTGTTVKIRAESGSSHIQPNGTYAATVLVTAVPN